MKYENTDFMNHHHHHIQTSFFKVNIYLPQASLISLYLKKYPNLHCGSIFFIVNTDIAHFESFILAALHTQGTRVTFNSVRIIYWIM